MFDFLRTLFTDGEARDFGGVDGLELAIERIVAGTDPRLGLLPAYRERLRPAAARALEHARACVAALAAAHRLDAQVWASDPLIHACFGSAERLAETLAQDDALGDFAATAHGHAAPELYAVLGLSCEERATFGIELEGGVLRRDVPQTVVVFTRPVLLAPALTEADCREAMVWTVFDFFVQQALLRLTALCDRRETLQTRYRLHLGKLRAFGLAHRGLQALGDGAPGGQEQRRLAEQQLLAIEAELREAVADVATLDDYLQRIVEVLAAPERQLALRRRTLRLDRVGIRIDDPARPAQEIAFDEAVFEDGRVRVPMLVRIRGTDLRAPGRPVLPIG